MRTLAVLGGALVLAVIGFFARTIIFGEVQVTPEQVRQTPYFHVAAQQISLDQDVLDALGQPLEFGAAQLKSQSEHGDLTTVVLDLQVKGPKGSGHGQVTIAETKPSIWVSKGGDFFLAAGGRPIRLDAR